MKSIARYAYSRPIVADEGCTPQIAGGIAEWRHSLHFSPFTFHHSPRATYAPKPITIGSLIRRLLAHALLSKRTPTPPRVPHSGAVYCRRLAGDAGRDFGAGVSLFSLLRFLNSAHKNKLKKLTPAPCLR